MKMNGKVRLVFCNIPYVQVYSCAEILRLHLRDEQLGDDVDLHDIANKTEYYSGSDIKGEFLYSVPTVSPIYCALALCVSAAMASVKDSVGDFSWTSHLPGNSSGEPQSKFHTRTITLNNFAHAINEVPPSSSAGSHSELLRWHDQFVRKRTLDNSGGEKPQINGQLETRTHGGNNGRRYNWKG
jgi:SpoVK/Ycf46/Vps4 family AAA+-type ATPase